MIIYVVIFGLVKLIFIERESLMINLVIIIDILDFFIDGVNENWMIEFYVLINVVEYEKLISDEVFDNIIFFKGGIEIIIDILDIFVSRLVKYVGDKVLKYSNF